MRNIGFLNLWMLVVIGALWGCLQNSRPFALPEQFAGYKLQQQISGAQAAKLIEQLHGDEVAPQENLIGLYGDQMPPTVIYLSRFSSSREARKYLKKMAEEIGPGSSGFAHHATFEVQGNEIHFVVGQGQAHYFFRFGQDLYWLALPMEKARQGLAEILGQPPENIPSISEIFKRQRP